jgi:signal transduction histidine kinase
VSGDSVELVGDAKRLQQVFWNLLSNGVRFGREGGLVSVKAESEGHSVRITVEDDGPGIDPEFLPHVFEPFRQADASPRRAHDGLGLGLAIARHLVELHGGSMSAANRPRGGAQLTVVLPAKAVVSIG